MNDYRKVVTTAGTAVRLESAARQVNVLYITAETDNTGFISIGGSGTNATATTQRGIILVAGQTSPPILDVNLYNVYINSSVSGDGVSYAYN